jgi:polysaccharide deacetylase family protein (PEP-CTERM system associated)
MQITRTELDYVAKSPGMTHHFTIDVEEYFQVSALERVVARDQWDSYPSRVVSSMQQLAELLDAHGARATMFVLGVVAERHPALVRELSAAGHEIASHGWGHRRVMLKTPAEFRDSVRRTRACLEDLTGRQVYGFRAPSFSIVPGCEWALDILIEEGYRYDSSLFPVQRNGYGFPGGGRDPYRLDRAPGPLHEVPPATVRLGGRNLPAGGGAYFRLLPYALVDAAFRQAEQRGAPATFYIHPWEVDPGQPRLAVDRLTRIRHYGGLHRTVDRLRRLLRSYRFRPIAETLELEREPCTAP